MRRRSARRPPPQLQLTFSGPVARVVVMGSTRAPIASSEAAGSSPCMTARIRICPCGDPPALPAARRPAARAPPPRRARCPARDSAVRASLARALQTIGVPAPSVSRPSTKSCRSSATGRDGRGMRPCPPSRPPLAPCQRDQHIGLGERPPCQLQPARSRQTATPVALSDAPGTVAPRPMSAAVAVATTRIAPPSGEPGLALPARAPRGGSEPATASARPQPHGPHQRIRPGAGADGASPPIMRDPRVSNRPRCWRHRGARAARASSAFAARPDPGDDVRPFSRRQQPAHPLRGAADTRRHRRPVSRPRQRRTAGSPDCRAASRAAALCAPCASA